MTAAADRHGAVPAVVHLVFASVGAGEAEPLVAVVSEESSAVAIETAVQAADPGTRVRWETHEIVGDGRTGLGEVHVVLLAAGSANQHDELEDPIGVAVHAERAAAEQDAARRSASDGHLYAVRTYARGWRRGGWPFEIRA